MKCDPSKQLLTWNCLYKETNELYHHYATAKGISDSVLWILYFICLHGGICTQRKLCQDSCDPLQTIHSSLKRLEQQGLVTIQLSPGSRKNKEIYLTPAGEAFAEETVLPLIQAEQHSFTDLSEQEQNQMLTLMQKHLGMLRQELEQEIQTQQKGAKP